MARHWKQSRELLGHSPKSGYVMTKRYSHLSIDNLHEAVARISKTNSTTIAPAPISGDSRRCLHQLNLLF